MIENTLLQRDHMCLGALLPQLPKDNRLVDGVARDLVGERLHISLGVLPARWPGALLVCRQLEVDHSRYPFRLAQEEEGKVVV